MHVCCLFCDCLKMSTSPPHAIDLKISTPTSNRLRRATTVNDFVHEKSGRRYSPSPDQSEKSDIFPSKTESDSTCSLPRWAHLKSKLNPLLRIFFWINSYGICIFNIIYLPQTDKYLKLPGIFIVVMWFDFRHFFWMLNTRKIYILWFIRKRKVIFEIPVIPESFLLFFIWTKMYSYDHFDQFTFWYSNSIIMKIYIENLYLNINLLFW